MDHPENMRLKIEDVLDKIINEYNLHKLVNESDCLYAEVTKGMYGLSQAGILAQQTMIKQTWLPPTKGPSSQVLGHMNPDQFHLRLLLTTLE